MAITHTNRSNQDDTRDGRLFAPCRARCPIHVDVPGYLAAIAEGRFMDALEIILARNPLPSVCGRVCLRPCEDGCRRCLLDEPVAIAALKRAAADTGVYPAPRLARRIPGRIAIVGGGPAGLTAAHDLAALGLSVSIYEDKPRLGGMLRYGIPNYRLPDYALDRDIEYVLSHGIEAHTGVRIGRDITIEELSAQYDAVLVTVGLQDSRALPIPGADKPRVLKALPFLEACANGESMDLGARVVVIGGGNVAMDVARAARRHHAKEVRVVCLESRDTMPAAAHEIHDAEMEGITVHCSWGPREITGENMVEGLRAVRCERVFDLERRFAPVFDEETVNEFAADTIIFAIGQGPDIDELGLPVTFRNSIMVDPVDLKTSVAGVYAAGDIINGPTKIIDAIASGHRAAASIFRDLTGHGDTLESLDQESAVLGRVPDTMAAKVETRRRIQMERLEHWDAILNFDEVELGYTEFEASREAQRCLSCTAGARLAVEKCASCLTCTRVCPHGAACLNMGGYLYFEVEACHACGACVSQCPAQAINLETVSEEDLSRRVQRKLADRGMDTSLVFSCGHVPDTLIEAGVDFRAVQVSCLLRVSERSVFEALEEGASRIVFTRCTEGDCRFPHAQDLVNKRIRHIRKMLSEAEMSEAFLVTTAPDEHFTTEVDTP
ncbi:MAG: FAD-dependent oxidoreductase [Coriobacteriia bacterium]|nr:FAD-dependent oxidoreductase [Coriobacteriia bacterium]